MARSTSMPSDMGFDDACGAIVGALLIPIAPASAMAAERVKPAPSPGRPPLGSLRCPAENDEPVGEMMEPPPEKGEPAWSTPDVRLAIVSGEILTLGEVVC